MLDPQVDLRLHCGRKSGRSDRRFTHVLRRFALIGDRPRQYGGTRTVLDPGQDPWAKSKPQDAMMTALRDNFWLRLAAFLGLNLAACLVILELVILPVRGLLAERDGRIV